MSPTTEALKLPTTSRLEPRDPRPLTSDEHMVIREADGRVRAAIETVRADLLPN